MDQPEYFPSAGTPPSSRRELRGPRPTPLCVSKDSHKIKKKPPVAPQHNSHAPPPPHRPSGAEEESPPQQPMIIYAVSPKVIHASVSDFMLVVQRLTGTSSSSGGAVSPAARLASVEMTSPTERHRDRAVDPMGIGEEGVDVGGGRIPGILTPSPASLPTISPAMFSPATGPNTFSQLHDFSPFLLSSPSTLYSAPLVSPVQSLDLFNPFLDF